MRAGIGETEPRTCHQVLQRARHENLAGARHSDDPRADVHRDPAHIGARDLDLTRMQAGADFESGSADRGDDREGAADGARRAIERREQTIAHEIDQPSPVSLELPSCDRVMRVEETAPGAISHFGGALRRADDVGEVTCCRACCADSP
jgi:hypothetical protein